MPFPTNAPCYQPTPYHEALGFPSVPSHEEQDWVDVGLAGDRQSADSESGADRCSHQVEYGSRWEGEGHPNY